MIKIAAIIPARFASERFPGKMLEIVHGKPLINHVFQRVSETELFDEVIVATDHSAIESSIQDSGGKTIMTDPKLPSGTDRLIAACNSIAESYHFYVNVQGDEAMISQEQLEPLVSYLRNHPMANIVSLYRKNSDQTDFLSNHCVKTVIDDNQKALYFSRAPIPYPRDGNFTEFNQHVGVYAFSGSALDQIKSLKMGNLETIEKLEQLRWMEAGMDIHMVEISGRLIGVDTPEDLEKVKSLL